MHFLSFVICQAYFTLPFPLWQAPEAKAKRPSEESRSIKSYPITRSATMYAAVASTILGSVLCFHL